MPSTYIPRRDAELDTWLANFAERIAAAPGAYGLTAPDAETITAAVDAWHTAFTIAIAPGTRTAPAVRTKDERRASVLRIVREYAGRIRVNAAVAPALKIDLGLHVSSRALRTDSGPPLIPAPATAPVVLTTGLRVGAQTIRLRDSATPQRRARPRPAAGALLYRVIAEEAVLDPHRADFVALVTRDTYQSAFDSADRGKTATYFARWVSAKGEPGPWSAAASMRIAA